MKIDGRTVIRVREALGKGMTHLTGSHLWETCFAPWQYHYKFRADGTVKVRIYGKCDCGKFLYIARPLVLSRGV